MGLMLSLRLLQIYWQENCLKRIPIDGNNTGEGTQSDSWDFRRHNWATPLLSLALGPGVSFPGMSLPGPKVCRWLVAPTRQLRRFPYALWERRNAGGRPDS